ncbi:MAG: UDP-N-acetylmuramoyl-L-alanine--D-glutamate ligase [Victivallaceae bacterium]
MKQNKIAILGLGKSGQSVLRYLVFRGERPLCIDSSNEVLSALQCKDGCLDVLRDDQDIPEDVVVIVRSPGIKDNHLWIQQAIFKKIPITTEFEMAFKHRRLKYPLTHCLGVTGTNGKTTTVLFIEHLLNICGVKTLSAGNIGTPFLNVCDYPDISCFVLEMSSFQISHFMENIPFLSAAAVLNLSKNHLDYHGSMERYIEAKTKIRNYILPHGDLYVGKGVPMLASEVSVAECVEEFLDILEAEEKLTDSLYPHDLENYAVGYKLAKHITRISETSLTEAICTFVKPEHRLEPVLQKYGITFINDSKSTTVDSVQKAVLSVNTPQILILGGKNKGGDFSLLRPYLKSRVRTVLVIGESADEIETILKEYCDLIKVPALTDAIDVIKNLMMPGDTVLFSPGCASFDQFANYEERGKVFKKLIFGLKGEEI